MTTLILKPGDLVEALSGDHKGSQGLVIREKRYDRRGKGQGGRTRKFKVGFPDGKTRMFLQSNLTKLG